MRTPSSSSSLPEGYKADPKQGAMLRYQASLRHLPVPPLASTLAKYLETILPHLTPSEYAHSESMVRTFGTSAQAAELQGRLEARAADPATVNWLANWWDETAYMAYRDSVVVNVSYFTCTSRTRLSETRPSAPQRYSRLCSPSGRSSRRA
jgi:carnitine O-acetyltransferase